MFRPSRVSLPLFVFCCCVLASQQVNAQQKPLPYKPGDAAVAVVLGPNLSTDKWKELKVKEALKAQVYDRSFWLRQ